MKILIVDDDDTTRNMLNIFLSNQGFEVVTAENGNSALDLMRRPGSPDLILLDWMMPDIDGTLVAKEIRDSIHDRAVYIIMATALDREADIRKALAAGVNDYLIKPFDIDELIARLNVGAAYVQVHNDLGKRLAKMEQQVNRMVDENADSVA